MIETIVVGAINLVLGVASGIFMKIADKRADAKTSIIKAFRKEYIEFGNSAAAGVPDPELEIGGIADYNFQGVEIAAEAIQRLHWRSMSDINRLNRIEWILSRALQGILMIALVAVVSNIVGNFAINEEGITKTLLRFCIPGIVAFSEVMFVIWMANTGSYLKSVINTYDNREF